MREVLRFRLGIWKGWQKDLLFQRTDYGEQKERIFRRKDFSNRLPGFIPGDAFEELLGCPTHFGEDPLFFAPVRRMPPSRPLVGRLGGSCFDEGWG
jgi:hypothetical protein